MSSGFDDERQHAVEVIPGFILGGIYNLEEILYLKPDVLFPLDRLPGWVWNSGFRGEIVYYPITDYDVLPDDVLDKLAEAAAERLRAGKRVGMFCIGGHGRTALPGAACVTILFRGSNHGFEGLTTLCGDGFYNAYLNSPENA